MPTDGEDPDFDWPDHILPDEKEVIRERGRQLDEADEDDLLTVEEVADELDIDLD